ncbi:glycerol-3-phosphate dehydrogenase (NAD(+)) [Salvia divinorum]|uniref:glycerol-3-phosphate dehydrogenase (NAD(+)) n=1 Tax=Salvia divinorum TaxID=28513 RepID=A0ABD1HJY8_SALDI
MLFGMLTLSSTACLRLRHVNSLRRLGVIGIPMPVIISLAKGIEAELNSCPRIITPTQMISQASGVSIEKILCLGGPNIASEICNKEYANVSICGSEKWRLALAKFLRQPQFIVWDNSDVITHEVMGGLKNVYAIGAGMVAALTKESATGKSVYFAHCTSEMIFIAHLLTEEPEKLAGQLLADTNYSSTSQLVINQLADLVCLKTGVSAIEAFYELLRQPSLNVLHSDSNKQIAPVELCSILEILYKIRVNEIVQFLDTYSYIPT